MDKYYWKLSGVGLCLIAHRIYERSDNPDNPDKSTFICEVKGEKMARFITDAMNDKLLKSLKK